MSRIIVDDINPNIQYSGPWFTAQNSQLDIGNFGPPFQNTLHGVNANASFSYSFSGSAVIVLGASTTTNASGTQDPTWECFVDNISIGYNLSAGARTENSWIFCQRFALQDGPHVLSTNVTVSNQQTFWFDQIQYLPSSNVPLDNSTVRVDSTDPTIQYSSGWTELDNIVNVTQTAGLTVTYLVRVSLSWIGFVPLNFSHTPSSAIYSIDGQTPISFFVPALSAANTLSLYNQVLFKTETLSPGQHTLIATYQGNSGTAPLALDTLIVQNATSPSTSSSSVPSSSSSSNSTSNSSSKKSPLVGIIVGVVGGAIVLVLLVLLLLYIRRRNNRRAQKPKENYNPEPFPILPNSPQNYTSEVPFLTTTIQPFSSKFSRRRESAIAPGSSRPTPLPVIGAGINMPRNYTSEVPALGTIQPISSKFSRRGESAIAPGSSRPTPPPVIEAGINPISPAIRGLPLMQPSSSAQGGDPGFLQHAESGASVPMPHAEGNLDDLPPVYTS